LKSKLKYILILLLDFSYYKSNSQNLIMNGSFENYTGIDCVYGGFDNYNATPAYHVLDNWYGYFTPDYFSSNCTNPYAGVPSNFFGYSNTKNGNAYIGFAFYQKTDESKEYVYQQLATPLQAGKMYCLSFYVSRSYRSTYAIKNIEVLFSNTLINLSNGYIQANPQIVKQVNFIADTTIWTEIQGCFTADGGEQYLMIGNFNSNANTDTLFIGTTNPIPFYGDFSYYYIDEITLIDQTTVGINELDKENSFDIYPNPTNSILNIKSNNQQLQNATIEIKNTLGQVIYFDVYAPQIHISNLPSGIYFLTINNKEDKRTIKFIKD